MASKMRVKKAIKQGTVSSIALADSLLNKPGDFIVVRRGTDRNIIMLCPEGCGERIVLNLDRRVGPAWRFYDRKKGASLYPSVWRDTGCQSHFVLWNNNIYWIDDDSEYRWSIRKAKWLERKVYAVLSNKKYTHFTELADKIREIPWDVLDACRELTAKHYAVEGIGDLKEMFKKI